MILHDLDDLQAVLAGDSVFFPTREVFRWGVVNQLIPGCVHTTESHVHAGMPDVSPHFSRTGFTVSFDVFVHFIVIQKIANKTLMATAISRHLQSESCFAVPSLDVSLMEFLQHHGFHAIRQEYRPFIRPQERHADFLLFFGRQDLVDVSIVQLHEDQYRLYFHRSKKANKLVDGTPGSVLLEAEI